MAAQHTVFGVQPTERATRGLAGMAAAGVLLGLAFFWLPAPSGLTMVGMLYLLAFPVFFAIETARPSPTNGSAVRRYALTGLVLGPAAILALGGLDDPVLIITVPIAAVAGGACGALAAAVGANLANRAVTPVALVGGIVVMLAIAPGWWWMLTR